MSVPTSLRRFLPRLVIAHHAGREGPPEEASEQHVEAAVMLADISGFTRLTERLARDAHGAEELTRILNGYFGALIDRIHASGGDVVKFAGDALLVLWPAGADSAENAVWRAARCGLDLQQFSEREQPPGPNRLSLKVSVGLGPFRLSHLGGRDGHWEVLVTGQGLAQLAEVTRHVLPGQVLLTPAAETALGERAQLERFTTLGAQLIAVPPAPPAPAATQADASEAALRGYLPPSVLDRLGAGGDGWLSELRTATVMFVNFPNATHETPLERAQGIMEALQVTLERHEGVLNKLSCDEKGVSMVAAFGLPPRAHEDDPARAVLAALSLHSQLKARDVRHAIGLATGRVFCGVVGSAARCEYTVMGDTVNLAARLMQAAKEDVLCDDATAQRARRRAEIEALPPIAVKGKAGSVAVHRPLGERLGAKPTLRPRAHLFGRERECEEALAPLQQLAAGGPGVPVLIEGEPGIGKSCLVAELSARAGELGLLVLTGAGDPVHGSRPYSALVPALVRMLGLEEASTDERVERALAALGSERAPLLPLIAPLLDLPPGETPQTAELTGPLRADRTRHLLFELFCEGPRRVLLVEDAHWLDSASWSLLLAVQRSASGLCLVLTTRPMPEPPPELPALASHPGARHLRLAALAREEALRLACMRLGVDALPPPAAALLLRRAGGHPYFTEELALALRDSGKLRIQDGRAELTGALGDDAELPHSVEGAVIARVDRLAPPQQLALKAASVIGRSFAPALLEEIYPLEVERERLGEHLDALCQLGLVEEEPQGGLRFKHALTREAVYAQVLRSTRRELHRAVAEALERRPGSAAATLAHHWFAADEPARAGPHLERAGAHALEGGGYREATRFLRQALEHGDTADALRPARIHRLLGDACLRLGDLPQSRAELEQAVAMLGHPAPRPGPLTAIALVGRLLQRMARHAFGPSRSRGDAERRLEGARAYERLGQVCFFFNEPIATLHASAVATELAEPTGHGPERARAYVNLCLGLSLMPLPWAARVYEERARRELEHGLPQADEAWVRMVLAMLHTAHGRKPLAREHLERAFALGDALGDSRRSQECAMILTQLDLLEDRVEEALARSRAIVAEGIAGEDVHMQSGSNAHLAASLSRLGRWELAREAAERASECADRAGARAEQVYARGLLGLIRLKLGDRPGAISAVTGAQAASEGLLPTAVYAFEGYAAAAEAALELQLLEVSAESWRRWRLARRALSTYARTFPVARPRLAMLDGRASFHTGDLGSARRKLSAAVVQAEQLAQPHDQEIAKKALEALGA